MSETLPKAADFFNKQKDAVRQTFASQIERALKNGAHEIRLLRADDWFLDEVSRAGWDVQQFNGGHYIKLPGTLPPGPSVLQAILIALFIFYVLFFVVSALILK